jgi:hypothetical protein
MCNINLYEFKIKNIKALSPNIATFLLDTIRHTCNPSYSGGRSRRILVQRQLRQLARPYLNKPNIERKGLRAWLKW